MPLPDELNAKLAALEQEGWRRQFTSEEPRLSEAVELYESLGYEVRVEVGCSELAGPECAACYGVFCDRYKTIFVRPRAIPGNLRDTVSWPGVGIGLDDET